MAWARGFGRESSSCAVLNCGLRRQPSLCSVVGAIRPEVHTVTLYPILLGARGDDGNGVPMPGRRRPPRGGPRPTTAMGADEGDGAGARALLAWLALRGVIDAGHSRDLGVRRVAGVGGGLRSAGAGLAARRAAVPRAPP